ncbi:hypothetical protein HC928_15745 [bacterium]|nr:hypothetical protein [bacterium]
MKNLLRGAGSLLLLTLLIGPFSLSAQEPPSERVVGSGIVAPVIEALAAASNDTGEAITVDITGTANGFAAFCNGEAAATMANQPITAEQEAACVENNIPFDEYLLGHHIVTAIVNPDVSFATCLDITALRTVLAPSASGTVTDWLQLDIAFPEQPRQPPDDHSAASDFCDNHPAG